MVDGVNKGQATVKARHARGMRFTALTVFCAMAWAPPAVAADIADPTRPPSGFSEKAAEAPPAPPLRVSSVFLMGKQPYAMLDGRVVRIGDRLEAGRISKIDESGIWLKTPAGPRQLKLLPDVEKTPAGMGRKKVEQQ